MPNVQVHSLDQLESLLARAPEVESLDLFLSELPAGLERFSRLKRLCLWRMRLYPPGRSFPPGLRELSSFSSLPFSLTGLPELRSLFLVESGWEKLPPEFSELLPNLTSLAVRNNRLRALPDLSRLTGLTALDLEGNRLEELPEWIGALAHLGTVTLSRNSLRRLPALPSSLRMLDAPSNLLTEFFHEGQLDDLDLSENRLERLGPVRVKGRLKLAGNRLTSLPDLPLVPQQVDVRNNRLERLPVGIPAMVVGNPVFPRPVPEEQPPGPLPTDPEGLRLRLASLRQGEGPTARFLRAHGWRANDYRQLLQLALSAPEGHPVRALAPERPRWALLRTEPLQEGSWSLPMARPSGFQFTPEGLLVTVHELHIRLRLWDPRAGICLGEFAEFQRGQPTTSGNDPICVGTRRVLMQATTHQVFLVERDGFAGRPLCWPRERIVRWGFLPGEEEAVVVTWAAQAVFRVDRLDLATGQCVAGGTVATSSCPELQLSHARLLYITPNGRLGACGLEGEELPALASEELPALCVLKVLPDGTPLAGTEDGRLVRFGARTEVLGEVRKRKPVTTLAPSPQGDRALSGGREAPITEWDLTAGASRELAPPTWAELTWCTPGGWLAWNWRDRELRRYHPGGVVSLELSGPWELDPQANVIAHHAGTRMEFYDLRYDTPGERPLHASPSGSLLAGGGRLAQVNDGRGSFLAAPHGRAGPSFATPQSAAHVLTADALFSGDGCGRLWRVDRHGEARQLAETPHVQGPPAPPPAIDTGMRTGPDTPHGSPFCGLGLRDGTLTSLHEDGTLRRWSLTGELLQERWLEHRHAYRLWSDGILTTTSKPYTGRDPWTEQVLWSLDPEESWGCCYDGLLDRQGRLHLISWEWLVSCQLEPLQVLKATRWPKPRFVVELEGGLAVGREDELVVICPASHGVLTSWRLETSDFKAAGYPGGVAVLANGEVELLEWRA